MSRLHGVPGATSFKMSSLSTAIGDFGLDLFKQELRHDGEGNIFFAPLSIAAALAMVLYGARGDTETEMKKVLHLNEAQSATTGDSSATEPERNTATGSQCDRPGGIHSQLQALLSQLNKPTKDYDLSIANRLYAAIGFEFLPHYLHCIQELYHAGLETVDFAKATEKTRELINNWIETQTHGKIKDFYPPRTLNPEAVLVLVNAVYFKGKWESRFKEENTEEAPFWVNKNESRNVPMMVQHGDFKIANLEDPPLQVLELLYDGKELSMMIFLPKDTGDDDFSLKKLASSLTYKNLEEWTGPSKMFQWPVYVHLPRFKLEKKYDLNKSLESMGMTHLFHNADLSGMSQKPLVVSKVSHQSYVEVNEEGTEATGVTGVGIAPTSAKVPIEFVANRPFIFLIEHCPTNTILFIGKYSSP